MKSTLVCLFYVLMAFALELNAQPTDIETIINNPDYILGFADDASYQRADRGALMDLISQISVRVESSFEDVIKETDESLSEFAQSIVKTYSSAILTNTMKHTETLLDGKYRVYRYIKVTDKNRIFRSREIKIVEYVKTANHYEESGEYSIALRHFYWAYVLLRSHPDKDMITAQIENETKLLTVFLTAKIQKLLNSISIGISHFTEDQNNYCLYITANSNGELIKDLNLNYFDGSDQISSSIKDGKGVAIVPVSYLSSTGNVDISIDYTYSDLLGDIPQDEEVKMVSEYIYVPFKSRKSVKFKNISAEKHLPEIVSKKPDNDELADLVQGIIDAIKAKNYDKIEKHFTDQGFSQFIKIMNYGKVSLYSGEHDIHFIECGYQTHIRSIPLIFELTDLNRKVVYDDIVLIIENGKITWVNFGIGSGDVQDCIQRGIETGDLNERMMGLMFMEYYKTIFAMKDIGKIAQVFSDSAVIFIGYVKKTEDVPQNMKDIIKQQVSLEEVEHIRFTKTEYIDRLKNKAFRNPFVNIQFSDLEIVRRSLERPIFAIQLHQSYYSTNYADEGYLLLFMDFTNEEEPKIFFRYWQPGRITDEDQKKFGISDLRF